MTRSWRVLPAALLLWVIPACGEVGPAPLSLGDATAVVPAARDLGEQVFRDLELGPKPLLIDGETMVVTRVGNDVVRITEVSSTTFEAWSRAPFTEIEADPGPLVEGLRTFDLTFQNDLYTPTLGAQIDDSIVQVASRTMTLEELATVLADLELPLSLTSVPGAAVGAVVSEVEPQTPTVSYGTEGYSNGVTVWVASAEEQAAYLALMVEDPRPLRETVDSCCPSELLREPRTVEMLGVDATIATLGSLSKLVVIPGEPGIVAVAKADRIDPAGPPDQAVIDVLEAADLGAQADLEALVASLEVAERERTLAGLRRAAAGRAIAHEGEVRDQAYVVVEAASGELCMLSTTEPPEIPATEVCVTSSPASPIAIGSIAGQTIELYFGAVTREVESVALEFPEAARPAEILTLTTSGGPARVFVLMVPLMEQIELTGDDLTAGMPRIAFVATDASGAELARVPLFPHLQDG